MYGIEFTMDNAYNSTHDSGHTLFSEFFKTVSLKEGSAETEDSTEHF
jgi:hypothetical protein